MPTHGVGAFVAHFAPFSSGFLRPYPIPHPHEAGKHVHMYLSGVLSIYGLLEYAMSVNIVSTHRDPNRRLPDSTGMGGAGLRAFVKIAEHWSLSIAEQLTLLGIASRSTFFKWRRMHEPRLPRDTLERLSYLLGIYKSLQILLPEIQAADEWIRKPNMAAPFGGRSALERMLSGQVVDLYIVRQYLDAERG
jgi:hypothetical protein